MGLSGFSESGSWRLMYLRDWEYVGALFCGYCLKASMTDPSAPHPVDSRLRGNDGEGRGNDGMGRVE